jgi:predicted RNA-binding Zn-ribbon protein involved in translation (DUF1610 family)
MSSASERTCPKCGKSGVEPKGVTAAFYPRQIVADRTVRRDRKVVERRYQCRECGHEFSEVEESEF